MRKLTDEPPSRAVTAPRALAPEMRHVLEQVRLFEGLPAESIAHIARHAVVRDLRDAEALFFKNDACDFLALVLHGRIYKLLHGPDGQELIVETISPGDCVDETVLLDSQRMHCTAVAHGHTRVLLLARRHFEPLLSQPTLMARASAVLCARLRQTVERLETMCLHRLESRLARYFLSLLRDADCLEAGAAEVALPPTQTILAAMVNASRPKLNAQLRTWHRSGLVSRKRNILRIHDLAQLRCKAQLACAGGLPPLATARRAGYTAPLGSERAAACAVQVDWRSIPPLNREPARPPTTQ